MNSIHTVKIHTSYFEFFCISQYSILWFVIQGCGPGIIRASGVDPVVGTYATQYLNIRALAQPAALSILACQASLLAQKDSVTPLATVLLACVINIIGDVVLITVSYELTISSILLYHKALGIV